jgi:hypothetical protein
MVGSHHMLFEGNYGFNMDSDDSHGAAIYHTFFRNYASAYRARFISISGTVVDDVNNVPGGNGPLRAAGAMAYSYWMSFIGNVLATSGHTSGWVYDTQFPGFPGVWLLSPYPTDGQVAATAVRHGNFDYVTNNVHWDPTISNQTLPNSFYLAHKPAFFNAGSGFTWP